MVELRPQLSDSVSTSFRSRDFGDELTGRILTRGRSLIYKAVVSRRYLNWSQLQGVPNTSGICGDPLHGCLSSCVSPLYRLSKGRSNPGTRAVMITLRVGVLWDSNKRITYMMLGGFSVTYSATVVCFILTIIDLRSEYTSFFPSIPWTNARVEGVFFFPPINSCVITHIPRLANGIWIAMVSYLRFGASGIAE